jgi:hypothetical protein
LCRSSTTRKSNPNLFTHSKSIKRTLNPHLGINQRIIMYERGILNRRRIEWFGECWSW